MRKIVEIKELNFTYPDGTKALNNVNLEIYEGDSLGIIGPNGAGKSTLLLHLNGILKGDGFIRVFDLELNNKNLPAIRSFVGMVFQDPDNQLFMPTVFEDVAFGCINMSMPKDKIIEAVNLALKEVDMLHSVKRPTHHLSLGEKRRISLATVLSMKPKLLVLDEPVSNLDPKNRWRLIKTLNKLTTTKIIATHDLNLVSKTCNKALIIDNGTIIKIGPTHQILNDLSLLERHSLYVLQ